MKILYILKQDPEATVTKIMEAHKKSNDVTVVNLQEDKNYSRTIELIFSSDKVISW